MTHALQRRATTLLLTTALAGMLFSARSAVAQPSSATPDMNVTLSVYTCCGSLQGFNSNDPSNIFSIYNIYHSLLTKAYPHLKWNETIVNDDAALETKLTLAVNAGNPPDMVFLQRGYLGFSVLRKLAQPLDQYFAQYHVSDSFFLPAMARWAHFGGHWWGIPAVSGPLAGQSVYLTKFMTPLGYNNGNLKTWDDYFNMSKKAVRFDKNGNLTRIGYWPGITSLTFHVWETMARGFCPVGHGMYNDQNQPTAADPCNVAFLTYLKKLSDLYGGYAKLSTFLTGDPDIWNGSAKDYMAAGKALISPSANAYWAITPFDQNSFGTKGGLAYQVTPLPPTVHGTMAEVANYPATQQIVIIPPGAKHPDAAFLVSKFITWDNGSLLGPSTNGSPVAADQQKWVNAFIAGEKPFRVKAGLAGNPVADLQAVQLQPALAKLSKAILPINPVHVYYLEQLNKATARVLYGQQSTADALAQVQRLVVVDEQRLQSQYGKWNW